MQTTSKQRLTVRDLNERNTYTRKMLRNFCIRGVNGGYVSPKMIQDLLDAMFPDEGYDVYGGGDSFVLIKWGKSIDPQTKLRRRKDIIPHCSYNVFKKKIALLCGLLTEQEMAKFGSAYRKGQRIKKAKSELEHAKWCLESAYLRLEYAKRKLEEVQTDIANEQANIARLEAKLQIS